MAKILNELPKVERSGRKPKYDYDKLFSHGEKAVQITKGEDFDCSVATMRHNLYRESEKREIAIKTSTQTGDTFSFKIFPNKKKSKTKK